MVILAISEKGREFIYDYTTSHEVSMASADLILEVLNKNKYNLKDGQVWFKHEVSKYDNAYVFAEFQKFKKYKGRIREVKYTRGF